MTGPLLILALLALVAGWGTGAHFEELFAHGEAHAAHGLFVPIVATLAFLGGAVGSWLLYSGRTKDPISIGLLRDKFYIDEIYAALIAGTQDLLAHITGWFDKWVLDGLFVRGLSGATWGFGFGLRFLQFGNLQGYALIFGIGVVAFMYFLVFSH